MYHISKKMYKKLLSYHAKHALQEVGRIAFGSIKDMKQLETINRIRKDLDSLIEKEVKE